MISLISTYMLRYLIKSSVIDDSDESIEIYRYGTEITISSFLNVVLVLMLGIVTSSVIESIIFLSLLVILRLFTGGYHADTYFNCNMILCINYVLVLVIYRIIADNMSTPLVSLVAISCLIPIFILCPIENENKRLSAEKKKQHWRTSVILGTLYGTAAVVLNVFKYKIGILILLTLLSVSIAVIAGRLKERRKCYE